MGQKVNPTCLRLHPENKHFDSCWFSERQYAHSIQKHFHIELYFNAILKQIQYPSASFFFEGSPRKSTVSVLFLNPSPFREQVFKQFGHAQGAIRNRKFKQNTRVSTKKRTTSLYGLLNKKERSTFTKDKSILGLLPPYFFTPPFLPSPPLICGIKNKEKEIRLKKEKSVFSVGVFSRVFCKAKNKEKTNKGKNKPEQEKETANLPFYKWQAGPGGKSTSPSFTHIVENRGYVTDGQADLQLKKSVCFNVLPFAISRYFAQRNLSRNLLSATSRFLLLQAFFYFLKKGQRKGNSYPEDLSHVFSGFPLSKSESENVSQGKHTDGSIERAGSSFLHSPKEVDTRGSLFFNLEKSSPYTYHIESIISSGLKSSCKIFLFRAQNVAQSALFIAEEIVYQLQRRNTFRQIKTKFLQELGNKPTIKGVRVTCVGRIGGRAKKAQRARGESFKMGQTSLHLFDSKVSFASKTALTPYGAVGVKVWVCWK